MRDSHSTKGKGAASLRHKVRSLQQSSVAIPSLSTYFILLLSQVFFVSQCQWQKVNCQQYPSSDLPGSTQQQVHRSSNQHLSPTMG